MTIPEGQYISQKDAEIFKEYLPGMMLDFKSIIYKRLLEVGTGKGHSTKFIAELMPDWTIYTVDGYGMYGGLDGRIYENNSFGVGDSIKNVKRYLNNNSNIVTIVGNSESIELDFFVDVLFIDGDHSYNGVRADFNNLARSVKLNGLILFHDYWNESYGVKKLVDEICKSEDWELLHAHRMAVVKKKRDGKYKI